MLLLIIGVQVLFDALHFWHVINWPAWKGLLPVETGAPLWVAWTWLKVWAVQKIQAEKNGE